MTENWLEQIHKQVSQADMALAQLYRQAEHFNALGMFSVADRIVLNCDVIQNSLNTINKMLTKKVNEDLIESEKSAARTLELLCKR